MNTGIHWLLSLSPEAPAAPAHLPLCPVTAVEAGGNLPLIAHICCEDDTFRAFDLLDSTHAPERLWIFEPNASAASAVRWIKAGAAHVISTGDELRDFIEQHCEA